MITKVKNTFISIVTIGLICLWTYSAANQLLDGGEFGRELRLQPFSNTLANLLRWLLPALELFIIYCLLFRPQQLYGFAFTLALLSAFSVYILLIRFNYFSFVPCTCAGLFKSADWNTQLLINLALLGLTSLTLFAIHYERKYNQL